MHPDDERRAPHAPHRRTMTPSTRAVRRRAETAPHRPWCIVCGYCQAIANDRCITCYQYLRRKGVDRPPELADRQGWLNAKKTLEALLDHFLAKVDRSVHPQGCWLWTAATIKGYGRFSIEGSSVLAHRFAYQMFVGAIPVDRRIDHRCRNKACVNPEHLEVVTQKENVRRSRLTAEDHFNHAA